MCYVGSTTSFSSGSGSGTEYMSVGSSDETLLENYFLDLSRFRFEQARESCVSSGSLDKAV